MKTIVATGKFKNPQILRKMVDVIEGVSEEKQAQFIGQIAEKFEGFHGGNFMVKEDGTFIDQTFWDSQEDIDRVMESELMKKGIEVFEKLLEGTLSIEYYNVSIHYPMKKSIMA